MKRDYTAQEIVFLALYAVFAACSIIDSSLIEIGTVMKYVRYLTIFLLLILFCRMYITSKRDLVIAFIIVLIFGIVTMSVHQTQLLVTMAFLICAKATTFRRIVWVSLLATLFSLFVVVGSCLMGFIPDYTYDRPELGLIAHSFGFSYYSEIPFLLLFLWIEYLYIRKKKLYMMEVFGCVLGSYLIFRIFSLRLVFAISIVCIILYVVFVKYEWISLKNRFVGLCAKIGFPVCAIGAISLAYFYNPNIKWMQILDQQVFNTRLANGCEAFRRYGASLFGQIMEMTGNTEVAYGSKSAADYFYVDCGYVYSYLYYGIVFTVIIVFVFAWITNRSRFNENKMLFVWAVIIMLFTVVNNAWLTVRYNPFIFVFPMMMEDNIKQKMQNFRKKQMMCVFRKYYWDDIS